MTITLSFGDKSNNLYNEIQKQIENPTIKTIEENEWINHWEYNDSKLEYIH